jgi:hypothetical protein
MSENRRTDAFARHWIDGDRVGSNRVSSSINPSNGEILGE